MSETTTTRTEMALNPATNTMRIVETWTEGDVPCMIRSLPRCWPYAVYVAVPPGHPWHGLESGTAIEGFGHFDCSHTLETEQGIPLAGSGMWWIGFDVGHVGQPPESQTFEAVRAATVKLAELAAQQATA